MSTTPRSLGKYELQEQLRQQTYESILDAKRKPEVFHVEDWKAFDTQLRRNAVIRFIHVDGEADSGFASRFEREVRVISSLLHPNIVQIQDFSFSQGAGSMHASIIMDYVEGQTLANFIHNTSSARKFPSIDFIVHLFAYLSSAIDYAHQKGIIHQLITPAGIVLEFRDAALPMPIFTDFGVAQMLGTTVQGNPYYISSERAKGVPLNGASDIYSLGVILYEICTGVPPFRGDSPSVVVAQHINDMPTTPSLINSNISPVLNAVILKSIAKDPATRFTTASFMAAALAEAFNMIEGKTLTPPATSSQNMLVADDSSTPSLKSALSNAPPQEPAKQRGGTTKFASGEYVPPSAPKRRRRGLIITLVALVLLLIGAGLGAFYLLPANKSVIVPKPIIGHAFFGSSGLLSTNTANGNNDQLDIQLQNIHSPDVGKSYYAWLLSDKNVSATATLSLGLLPISKGTLHYFYPGDSSHTNLLNHYSQLLITEEATDPAPISPSPDLSTWRYYAELPQVPSPTDPGHYSLLSHLRHLLSSDPNLDQLGLQGGLGIWLLKNTEKILEWSGAARDDWHTKSVVDMSNHFVRILDYLDGATYVQQDVPAGTKLIVSPQIARVALLEFDTENQNPPGYLFDLSKDLRGVLNSPGVTQSQRKIIEQDNLQINSVTSWLSRVRQDARQLVMMNGTQLLQPQTLSLLDDMAAFSLYAYAGRLDPATNNVQGGVFQIHYDLGRLAHFDITQY